MFLKMPVRSLIALALLLVACAHRPDLRDDGKCHLALPFPPAPPRLVLPASDRLAFDFAMPEGTPVLAAAPGIVVEVVDGFDKGGSDRALEERANRIIVDHGGARFAVYQHLQAGGALVKEGEAVTRGQPIGRSGNTGFSSQPHLHFAVVDVRNQSQRVCFADAADKVPLAGKSYGSARVLAEDGSAPAQPSSLAVDTFAANGVTLDAELPAHRWRGKVAIAGRAKSKKVIVAFYPRPRDGRKHEVDATVDDAGHFSVEIDTGAVAQRVGPFVDFMVAARGADGMWQAPFGVPLVLRDATTVAAR
jgi:hypothetical protein